MGGSNQLPLSTYATSSIRMIILFRFKGYDGFVPLYRMLTVGSRGDNSVFVTSDDTESIQGEGMGDSKTGRSTVGGSGTAIVPTECDQW